jgi:phosphoadenosine phosphosulfate reductase
MSTVAQPVAVFRGPQQPNTDIEGKLAELEGLLRSIADEFKTVRLASSLAAEDNVLFDAISRLGLPITAFSLDTLRLNAETLAVVPALAARYGKTVELIQPQPEAVERFVAAHGVDAIYDSVALRKNCCDIRKVEPLGRALADADAWLTGQRRTQSATRADLAVRETDAAHAATKFNPLADWSEADVWTYVRRFDVPVNELHHRGYPSIGCAPCTRAISIGEEIRAGRWWWEDPANKECGLHVGNRV